MSSFVCSLFVFFQSLLSKNRLKKSRDARRYIHKYWAVVFIILFFFLEATDYKICCRLKWLFWVRCFTTGSQICYSSLVWLVNNSIIWVWCCERECRCLQLFTVCYFLSVFCDTQWRAITVVSVTDPRESSITRIHIIWSLHNPLLPPSTSN